MPRFTREISHLLWQDATRIGRERFRSKSSLFAFYFRGPICAGQRVRYVKPSQKDTPRRTAARRLIDVKASGRHQRGPSRDLSPFTLPISSNNFVISVSFSAPLRSFAVELWINGGGRDVYRRKIELDRERPLDRYNAVCLKRTE